ncbi:4Fe-4S dicluster domain-containing protein [Arcanobacterium haemolyticum]|nr:4Fe-4S dicluster domain-containing protein [Arcanobacterium haemolyticum]
MSNLTETSVTERLAGNVYEVDEGNPHIEVNQEIARATGTGKLLVRVCPAHVYSEEEDGTIAVEYAACLECGTCLAVAAPGSLTWHYPAGAMGVMFREG